MIVLKKIQPRFTEVLVTCNKYTGQEKVGDSDIIDPNKAKEMVKEYQTVISVGSMVHDIKPGDIVVINPMKYAKFKQVKQNSLRQDIESYQKELVGFDFPILEVNKEEVMLLDSNDIRFVVLDSEEDGNTPEGVIPEK